MNRKEHILFSEHHGAKGSVCSLRFIFLFFLFSQFSVAQNTMMQYDINDPRNPICPCHKLQKQAEEEHAQQKNKQNNLDKVDVTGENGKQQKINLRSDDLLRSANTLSGGVENVFRHKKGSILIKKIKFRYANQGKRIKKVRSNYSVCYNW